MKSARKDSDETFICSNCEQELGVEFRFSEGFTPLHDDMGFETGEYTYYETCWNCSYSSIDGIAVIGETNSNVEDDLPF